jgi:hypothetical protein
MYMNKELLKHTWEILRKYFPDEDIIRNTKMALVYKDIVGLEIALIDFYLDPKILESIKENQFASWLESFLNNLNLLNYNLKIYSSFHSEISRLINQNDFRINDYQDYQKIETPTDLREEEIRNKEYSELDFGEQLRLEELRIQKNNILIAKYNQDLLISFLEDVKNYLKILKEQITSPVFDVTVLKEKEFVKTVENIEENAEIISSGMSIINMYNFEIILPFRSLYSLREDWENAIVKDKKRNTGPFGDDLLIKNTQFTFENIQSLISPVLKKISQLIDHNLIQESTNEVSRGVYIIKRNDDFFYNGKLIELSKKSDYYKTFCALYSLLPKGGEVEYKDLIAEIKSRITKTKLKSNDEMRKFIQDNLTGKSNGFMRYSKLPATMDNQKAIIEIIRGFGVSFNNEVG